MEYQQLQSHNLRSLGYSHMCGSSSRGSTIPTINSAENDQHQLLIRRRRLLMQFDVRRNIGKIIYFLFKMHDNPTVKSWRA